MFVLDIKHVNKLVNKYIGVSSGRLGDFSYRTHREFYMDCDLDINPDGYEGTTREKFIKILLEQKPENQAKILRAILERFLVNQEYAPQTRTKEMFNEVMNWINNLEQNRNIAIASPVICTDLKAVSLTLDDAESYLKNGKIISAVDRTHTGIHGYLKTICEGRGIEFLKTDSSYVLINKIKDSQEIKSQGEHITKIFRNLGSILQNMDALRDNNSLAHPNPILLDDAEAELFINSARTLLHYLDAKFGQSNRIL